MHNRSRISVACSARSATSNSMRMHGCTVQVSAGSVLHTTSSWWPSLPPRSKTAPVEPAWQTATGLARDAAHLAQGAGEVALAAGAAGAPPPAELSRHSRKLRTLPGKTLSLLTATELVWKSVK